MYCGGLACAMMCIIFDRVGGLQLSSAVNCENANDRQKKETASFKLSGECINIISPDIIIIIMIVVIIST